MPPFNTLGKSSKTTFLSIESHKLFVEFVVGASAVKAGMPLKLDSSGNVVHWAKADGEQALIGYAATDQAIGEYVTATMRGYIIIFAMSAGAVVPGPVTCEGYDASTADQDNTGFVSVDDGSVTVANCIGWALDNASGAGVKIRVVLKN